MPSWTRGSGPVRPEDGDAMGPAYTPQARSRVAPRPVAERLGVAFWLAAMWIGLVAALAACADLLPLPAYDRMDWHHPAAPPGTIVDAAVPANAAAGERSARYYLMGTDTMGRDMLSRLIHGARVSLAVGLTAPLIGLVFGGLLGMLAGYYRGRLETVVMGAMDTILAFPGLLLLLVITFYLGPDPAHIIGALGFMTIPSFARISRANTLVLAQHEFVQAARMIGQGNRSILLREILPNVLIPLLVYALLIAAYAIIIEGALSFLGLGVPAPIPSWGGMIAEGKEVLEEAGHVSLFPALALFLTVLSLNLMGDALRGVFDTREGKL
jgi:peptide/nickel transport system permease protein